jgi:primosomal protein N''
MNLDIQNSSTKSRRLTREELLAGQCEPANADARQESEDPRIKRPDELLNQLSALNGGAAAKELKELKARYEAEIAQWREYEKQVKEWKANVMDVVRQLRMQAGNADVLENDIHRLKSLLLSKEEELKAARISLERANSDRGFWAR